ncbi:MAG: hypothetical protein WD335_03005 [Candidatus Paceibacterota bacterium]
MHPIKTFTTILIAFAFTLSIFWILERSTVVTELTTEIRTINEITFTELDTITITLKSVALHHRETGWKTISYPNRDIPLNTEVSTNLDSVSITEGQYDAVQITFSQATLPEGRSNTEISIPTKRVEIPADINTLNGSPQLIKITIDAKHSLYRSNQAENVFVFLPHILFTSTVGDAMYTKNHVHVTDDGDVRYGRPYIFTESSTNSPAEEDTSLEKTNSTE